MVKTPSFNRLILRAVLRQVSPMVIRLVSVADQMPLHEFHDVFRTILGWNGDLGYIVRVHGQEINSFRRKTWSKALQEFKLHRQEKFLYICDTLHMWEWDVRVLDIQDGVEGDHARRRLWELMKSQGMQENQQVVFMSDGGENVRRVQEYLHPFSEHLIDWFHIAMRLTVLQQQTKALQEERPETGAEVSKRLESVKHLLWHGNTEEALERLGDLLTELSFIQARSNAAKKVVDGLDDFRTYICNNREFIPNFGERRRQGETISTAFVESTINQVVSRRFVKKQQMQWTLRGAHLLLQTRTRVLNEDLDDLFRRWYLKFRSQPQTQEPERKAA